MKVNDYGNMVLVNLPFALHADILTVGRQIIADGLDNDHLTAEPMFVVQKRVKHIGYDPEYAENHVYMQGSEEVTDPEEHARFDAIDQGQGDDPDEALPEDVVKAGFVWKWEPAYGPYFTQQAAEAMLDRKKHEGDLRVFVDSGVRNEHWKAMRALLIAVAKDADDVVRQEPQS